MIAGTGRSGTTWLADVINSQLACRIMFEPFHSRQVPAFRHFNYFKYMRPLEEDSALLAYCRHVFTGDIRHPWIDRHIEHILPKYRVIKEIRANLFLKWIQNVFPEIPLLFIIRHPCAVVLSRMELNWATDSDIDPFLNQKHLVNDFLSDKIDLIRSVKTIEEKHAVIWCISNIVPLKQFGSGQLNVIFYENLCLQPEVQIPRIFRALNQEYKPSVYDYVDKPSTTSRLTSAIVTGNNKVGLWKNKLSGTQIESILSIVEKFELNHIYGDSSDPLVSAV